MYKILLISYRTRKYMHVINQVLNIFFFLTQRVQIMVLPLGYQPKPSKLESVGDYQPKPNKLEFVEGFSTMVVL